MNYDLFLIFILLGSFLRELVYEVGDLLKVSRVFFTFLVNILGCFLIGLFLVYIDEMPQFFSVVALAGCGSLTTFSSLCSETNEFLESEKRIRAVILLFGSVISGALVLELGVFIGELFL